MVLEYSQRNTETEGYLALISGGRNVGVEKVAGGEETSGLRSYKWLVKTD